MSTIHLYDPRVGITYVYESKGYYDRASHKTKYHRKLIGKLDENGNVVPTGKRGRPKKEQTRVEGEEQTADYKSLYESYLKDSRLKEERIKVLESDLENEKKARKNCEEALKKIDAAMNVYKQIG